MSDEHIVSLQINIETSNCFTERCRKISSFKRSHAKFCVPVCRQI